MWVERCNSDEVIIRVSRDKPESIKKSDPGFPDGNVKRIGAEDQPVTINFFQYKSQDEWVQIGQVSHEVRMPLE